MSSDKHEPPPGPPPSRPINAESFDPPPGPPPNRQGQRVAFAPVTSQPGHLSTYSPLQASRPAQVSSSAADPSLQGLSQSEQHPTSSNWPPPEDPPPYHDWTVIPDTTLLPPPPSISYRTSPATNADPTDADRGHAFTLANPLWPPRTLSTSEQQALSIQFASLIRPREFNGSLSPDHRKPGVWNARSSPQCRDCCLLSSVPLYSALHSSPLLLQGEEAATRTVYFEVRLGNVGRDAGIAIGFVAPPYPTWRLPGWERASLGVHGDDGRRFVNDTWGGRDFTAAFKRGETVGIGMAFKLRRRQPEYGGVRKTIPMDVEIFFTRNGQKEAGWDLHEEVDAEVDQPGGVDGLEGDRDLYAAIGVFGAAEFTIVFGRHNWLYRPG